MKTGILFAASAVNNEETLTALSAVGRLAAGRAWGHDVRWGSMTPPRGGVSAGGIQPVLFPLALQQMKRDGFTHVAIQPLQVVSGAEFEKLQAAVEQSRHASEGVPRVAVGAPLLECYADLERVAQALLAALSGTREPGDAVILIGHGSTGLTADLAYPTAAWALGSMDRLAFLGCVNGSPDMADVLRRCREAKVKRALLLPFTLAAGSTVRAALAKTGTQSWVAALASEGIEGIPILKGLGENDAVAEIWLDHLEAALKSLVETP